MASTQFDAVVIGAGPGGYVAAIRLAQYGLKTAIVEKHKMGGECLNTGCIPSKALLHVGHIYESMSHSQHLGISIAGSAQIDLKKTVEWKNQVVNKLTGGVRTLLKGNKVEIIEGNARFLDAHTLEVTAANQPTPSKISAKNFIIATGSRGINLPMFDIKSERIWNYKDVLDLTFVPKTVTVVGGGVIGVELATYLKRIGVKVQIVELAPQILNGCDQAVVDFMTRQLKKEGLELHLQSQIKKVEANSQEVSLSLITATGEAKIIKSEYLLVAVGRKPNSEQLGLEKIGVKTDAKGFISVKNGYGVTDAAHIFAIGDVKGGALLAHKASKEGLLAAAKIAGQAMPLNQVMPAAIFCDPEIASVGLTEQEIKVQKIPYKSSQFPYAALGRALSTDAPNGFCKVLAHAQTDQILGVHIVGADASNLIGEATLAMEMGAVAEDLALTVHTHPTLSEALMEAAEGIHGKAIHMLNKPT